jgi:peptidyl-prolyl cis-trans isomerase C
MSGRKGKLAGLAGVLLLAGTAGVLPAQAPPAQPAGNAVVAKVNGVPIYLADLEAALRQTPVQLPADRKKAMQREALSMLMDEVLTQQFLAQNAPQVPEQEVDKKLAEITQALRQQQKTLQGYCQELGTTEAAMRKDILSRLRWAAYARSKVSDADAEKYYKENKDFFDGVTVHVAHIWLRLAPGTPDSDRARSSAQLTELRKQIVEKKIDFATAAKTYSQCESGPNGGDIGWIPRKMVVDENFARAAFITPVGQVSDVVQAEYGLHLILPLERKDGKPSTFALIKEDVRQVCMEEMWQAVLGQYRKAAKIEVFLP